MEPGAAPGVDGSVGEGWFWIFGAYWGICEERRWKCGRRKRGKFGEVNAGFGARALPEAGGTERKIGEGWWA
jgi:hypothetical protein